MHFTDPIVIVRLKNCDWCWTGYYSIGLQLDSTKKNKLCKEINRIYAICTVIIRLEAFFYFPVSNPFECRHVIHAKHTNTVFKLPSSKLVNIFTEND